MEKFNYLFQYEHYENEECVYFFKILDRKKFGKPLGIPESLYSRMVCIGCAYNMQYLSLLDAYHEYELNNFQIERFMDELQFLLTMINDTLLKKYIDHLLSVLKKCIYNEKKYSLRIVES